VIDALPIIEGCDLKVTGMPDFKVRQGFSAETSGGILTMMDPMNAREFIKEAAGEYGATTWIVGQVTKGSRKAIMREDAAVMQIKDSPWQ